MQGISEFMAADHDRLDSILANFIDTLKADMNSAGAMFNECNEGLRRHIEWEEEILLPVFEEKTGMRDMGPVSIMRMEHDHIRNCLQQISLLLPGDDFEEIEKHHGTLFEILSAHNSKEENVLYPWIDRETSREEAEELITRMKNS